ncbi:hypothetical protein QVD17_30099 [Tagetes erecta]|uniref:Uncharacterized protein n=1 Tax=Tagetes erecta TaxID=13708 RepID=A0AAD8K7A8_TARER|nr:hypothetical protein QVD17_30099 [Tagetes erecta]
MPRSSQVDTITIPPPSFNTKILIQNKKTNHHHLDTKPNRKPKTCGQEEYKLTIHQEPTGAPQEWSVTLINETPCVIWNVKLDCKEFQSRIDIDPKVVMKQGDLCVVKGGQRINSQESLRFVYAWDNQFPFKLAEQSIACKSI